MFKLKMKSFNENKKINIYKLMLPILLLIISTKISLINSTKTNTSFKTLLKSNNNNKRKIQKNINNSLLNNDNIIVSHSESIFDFKGLNSDYNNSSTNDESDQIYSLLEKKHKIKKKESLNFRFKDENDKDTNTESKKITDEQIAMVSKYAFQSLLKDDVILENFLQVQNEDFLNSELFPPIKLNSGVSVKIITNKDYFMENQAYKYSKSQDKTMPNSKLFFWSRLGNLFITFSNSKTDVNIISTIYLELIDDVLSVNHIYTGTPICIKLVGKSFSTKSSQSNWVICAENEEVARKWTCELRKIVYKMKEICNKQNPNDGNIDVIDPIIVIPENPENCNERWNYNKHGEDWQCRCSEGKNQSPIDLPSEDSCASTEFKPILNYNNNVLVSKFTTIDLHNKKDESLNIEYKDNTIKILSFELGSLETIDGAKYQAEEIVFHIPSEHTIKGEQFDMEVQIIHYGISKGDISKQAIISILFNKKPGSFNKFFDSLNYTNLPSKVMPIKKLNEKVNLNNILVSNEDEDLHYFKPFSFYSYHGSLTAPPCSEDTILYVKSKPMYLSTTAIELFKEALRNPDLKDNNGNIFTDSNEYNSSRKVQDRNKRPCWFYDCGDNCKEENKPEVEVGHYEKILKSTVNYFYVNGQNPSGVPNSFVVSDEEANGK